MITNWTVGRPGNEAKKELYLVQKALFNVATSVAIWQGLLKLVTDSCKYRGFLSFGHITSSVSVCNNYRKITPPTTGL